MRFVKTAGIIGCAVLAVNLVGMNAARAEEVRIGQVNAQRVLREYPGTKEFAGEAEKLQQQFAEARQSGDQEQLQQLQQKFSTMQGELFQKFQADFQEAAPAVSKKAEVDIIVSGVLYQKEGTVIIDVSDAFIAELE